MEREFEKSWGKNWIAGQYFLLLSMFERFNPNFLPEISNVLFSKLRLDLILEIIRISEVLSYNILDKSKSDS